MSDKKSMFYCRNYIFDEHFDYYVKSIKESARLRLMYRDFFINHWYSDGVQNNKLTIIRHFYDDIKKPLLMLAIKNDDVALFDMLFDDTAEGCHLQISVNNSFNIIKNSRNISHEKLKKIRLSLCREFIEDTSTSPQSFLDRVRSKYAPDLGSPLEAIVGAGAEIEKFKKVMDGGNLPNFFRWVLMYHDKFEDFDIHRKLLQNGIFLFIYDLMTNVKFAPYKEEVLGIILQKMKKGNINKFAQENAHIMAVLYEKDPKTVLNYIINNKYFLRDTVNSMKNIFVGDDRWWVIYMKDYTNHKSLDAMVRMRG